jgi:prepilin peptidase dependent protein B
MRSVLQHRTREPLARARGLGLLELLVGLAIGAIVLVASLSVFAQQLQVSRVGSQAARMAQDLRSSTALITRSVRQAVPAAGGLPALMVADAGRSLMLQVGGDIGEVPVAVGFRLAGGVIEMRLGDGRWQALTDVQTVRITQLRFRIDPAAGGCPAGLWMPAVHWEIVATPARPPARTETWIGTAQVRHPLPHPGCPS